VLADFDLLHKSKRSPPVVLFIDDAQFSKTDPALCDFLEKLTTRAWKNRWPILILITCWEYVWHEDRALNGSSVARIVADAKLGHALAISELKRLAACFPQELRDVFSHSPVAGGNGIVGVSDSNAVDTLEPITRRPAQKRSLRKCDRPLAWQTFEHSVRLALRGNRAGFEILFGDTRYA